MRETVIAIPRPLALLLPLLLAACAATTPLPQLQPALATPLPLTLHIERQAGAAHSDWLLLVQRDADGLRWSLFDPLGMPLARRLLDGDGWRQDGLLPPHAEAEGVFAALLFALTPAAALPDAYPAAVWSETPAGDRRLAPDWQVTYRAPLAFTLTRGATLRYRVAPAGISKPAGTVREDAP